MDREDKSFNERKKSKNDYNKRVTFDKLLIEYSKNELFNKDKFGFYEDQEIVNYIIYLSDSINDISQRFRNPAAHRGDISKTQAEYVINYLLFKEKLFVNFMDKIKG